ncbi:MAG: hypothetical protein EBR82_75500 [Caulobacteraceae bacterium]|nr:hypothetical protein [Caulobacteraceae bacterium]
MQWHPNGTGRQVNGMTLRDYFAGQAMQSIIGNTHAEKTRGKAGVPLIAGFAYEYADAMLKARQS